MLLLEVRIEPISEMRDVPLTWYIGLDAEGTRIGDALWHGTELDESVRRRVVALFRLTRSDSDWRPAAPEHDAIYLILAMTSDKLLRLKPQNLLTGLPAQYLKRAG